MNIARGYGRGKGGKRQRIGGPVSCICPKCGQKIPHTRGIPCTSMTCPKCGTTLVGSN